MKPRTGKLVPKSTPGKPTGKTGSFVRKPAPKPSKGGRSMYA